MFFLKSVLADRLQMTFSFMWVKCERQRSGDGCGAVFCWAPREKKKKRVSHFADSEEKLSGYTEDCGEELC